VATYRVDGLTGRLELLVRQDLGDMEQLAGDPQGSFVYAAYRNERDADPSIVCLAAGDGGVLVPVSEAKSRPERGSLWSSSGWEWLAAGSSRVYALWSERRGGGGQHTANAYVSHAVTEGGLLGPAYVRQFLWDDAGLVVLDPAAGMFYKAAPPEWVDGTAFDGLTAHTVEADGGLTQTGVSDLCGGTSVPPDYDNSIVPLVALRGVVFGRARLGTGLTVCSWEGPRLAPRGKLGDLGSGAAGFTPAEASAPALVAFAKEVDRPAPSYAFVRTDIRLLSVGTGADAVLLASAEFPARVRQLLFHPSGRFLYASGHDGRLRTYAIGPAGHLEPIEDLPAGSVAGPSFGYGSSSLSVSVRTTTPRL
jgi:hypothetical protein